MDENNIPQDIDTKKAIFEPSLGLEKRYEITPQMRYYVGMGITWVPFMMHCNPANYLSEVVNTDSQGFRRTFMNSELPIVLAQPEERPCSLWVGNSTAFGVGTSHDAKTVPSLLNSWGDGEIWINFASRSFLSTQEFIHFTTYHRQFKNINKVIIFSGLTNLINYFMLSKYSKEIGSFFYINNFIQSMQNIKTFEPRISNIIKKQSTSLFQDILDHEIEKEDLMVVIEKDLNNWKIYAEQLGFELIYILQPFALWLDKLLSPEEEQLFQILKDNAQDKFWKAIFQGKIGFDKYIWFKNKLKEICKNEKIRFYDINEHLATKDIDGKWLFTDPLHFNDYGTIICADIIKNEILR